MTDDPQPEEASRDDSNTQTDSESDSDQGVSYALIHEVESLTDYGALKNPESITAQVARGRGRGSVSGAVDVGDDTTQPNTYEVTVEEAPIKSETGYAIRFVNEEMRNLSAFDVISLDSVKAYPAPATAIESLTARIRGELKEYGYVKVRGAYSADTSRFFGVEMGWDIEEDKAIWDRLMEVIDQVSTTPAAVDYVLIKEGPDRWDEKEVARVRGVRIASIRGNVRAVENELDE